MCGYALWRGKAPERLVGAATALAWFGTPLLEHHGLWAHKGSGAMQAGVLAIDTLYLAIVLFVAFTSDRWWPMVLSAFQVLNIGMHLAALADHHLWPRAYYVGMEISSYLVLATLAAGVFLEARRPQATDGWTIGPAQPLNDGRATRR